MTSKATPTECYVYIVLPGQTEFATAGRLTLNDSVGRFVYGKNYLDRPDSVGIDPVDLKLGQQIYETAAFKGVFGALRDAGPDYWGRRVIEKHAGKLELSEMDYLLYAPDDRAGALGFGLGVKPPAPRRQFNKTIELAKLQAIADAIVKDEELPADADHAQVQELLLLGTSMGGARPKAVVEEEAGLWIAKFNRPDDKINMARIEHTMLVLARACGLTVAESKIVTIGNRDVLFVKRFDREKSDKGYLRARMISGLTLLQADESAGARTSWSYLRLVEELRRVCARPAESAVELFRRMCFNALISNTDDHPRNHAAIAKDTAWKLSPAYDLVPSTPVSLERRDLALVCGEFGRYANAENLLSQSTRFLVDREAAVKIVDDMERAVSSGWYATARREGVSDKDCAAIKRAFVYPGFRFPARAS